jgi:RNA polymerase sigma-70 factor (ECF subfamily)
MIPGRAGMPKRDLDDDARRAEFEATALPFMDALYTTARRLAPGGDRAGEAADLVQETYLRAFRTFENFAPGTNCRGWLSTIMYSVFINQYHKARRQSPTVSIDELEHRFQRYLEAPEDPGADIAMVEVGGGARMNPEVEGAMRQLPDEFRLPVLMVDVEGFSYEEAAEVMRCPVGTIRSRLYRGRRHLFALLKDYAAAMGFGRPTP